jgi:hypothetical protein
LIESAAARPEPVREKADTGEVHFALLGSEASLWPLAGVEGSF